MEILSFDTSNVENKIYDINSAIHAMKFAVNGLRALELINDHELNGLEYILKDARIKTEELLKCLSPVLTGNDKRIVLMFCEDVEKKLL